MTGPWSSQTDRQRDREARTAAHECDGTREEWACGTADVVPASWWHDMANRWTRRALDTRELMARSTGQQRRNYLAMMSGHVRWAIICRRTARQVEARAAE